MPLSVNEFETCLALWKRGEPDAYERLIPLVHPRLRQVAAALVQHEPGREVPQAGAAVRELYVQLGGGAEPGRETRSLFHAFCAKVMRRILIGHAQAAEPGAAAGAPFSQDLPWARLGSPELAALDGALDALARQDPVKVQLIELCCFLGLPIEEAASILDLAGAAAGHHLNAAKAWLHRQALAPGNG